MQSFTFNPSQDALILSNGESLSLSDPKAFSLITDLWIRSGWDTKYVYGFSWLGRPVIQLPEDMLRIQEVIYDIKLDVIVETGVAHGGSLVFYASLCTAMGKGRVIGIDIEIRPHNRKAIEEHHLSPLITLVEGSSVDLDIVNTVKDQIGSAETVLVLLDSNHLKEHVLAELEAYAPFVSPGSYIVAAMESCSRLWVHPALPMIGLGIIQSVLSMSLLQLIRSLSVSSRYGLSTKAKLLNALLTGPRLFSVRNPRFIYFIGSDLIISRLGLISETRLSTNSPVLTMVPIEFCGSLI